MQAPQRERRPTRDGFLFPVEGQLEAQLAHLECPVRRIPRAHARQRERAMHAEVHVSNCDRLAQCARSNALISSPAWRRASFLTSSPTTNGTRGSFPTSPVRAWSRARATRFA